ncbi:MAG: NUDIX hydrolase [Rhodobacteraceae bacterium]|jgi:8-oxo-dGTP pyrophosphatase MutT (NUDIX family)|nr:NUDIX hydrolase [Paracoccaceae bacterium]
MPIRLATRAVLVHDGRLLLVNAYPGDKSDLWCAPGGGAEPGASLPDNLRREVYEESGLDIAVGAPCLINEFHDPDSGYHQVDLFFRCRLVSGALRDDWQDPESVVTRRRFVTPAEMAALRVKPDSLADIAFGDGFGYDPLEVIVPA